MQIMGVLQLCFVLLLFPGQQSSFELYMVAACNSVLEGTGFEHYSSRPQARAERRVRFHAASAKAAGQFSPRLVASLSVIEASVNCSRRTKQQSCERAALSACRARRAARRENRKSLF